MGKNIIAKKQELDELMRSLREDEEYMARLDHSRKERDEILAHIKHLVGEVGSLQQRLVMDADNLSRNESNKINEKISSLKEEQILLNEKRRTIEYEIATLEEKQAEASSKNFDKYPCLANIRTLVDQKGIRLGDIERASGMTAGYMSRLEKPDNNSDPSIEFLVTAAKMLGVSLEELIYSQFGKLQPKEEKVLQFLLKLKEETVSGNLFWSGKEADDYLDLNPEDDSVKELHESIPLLMLVNPNGTQYVSVSSMLDKKANVRLNGFCLYSELSADSRIYIMKCKSGMIPFASNAFFEIYMRGEDGAFKPLLSTRKMTKNQLTSMVDALYREACKTISEVHLTQDIEIMIDAFLQ